METSDTVFAKVGRRQYDRSSIALPATVTLGGQEYGAVILNLAPGGAMITCSARFPPATSFSLRCGSINAESVVVWEKSGRYGVNFRSSVGEGQVIEQLSRNDAIRSRKLLKSQTGASADGMLRKPPRQLRDPTTPALAEHLIAMENSHKEVESYIVGLETIMGAELPDRGRLSAVRLRLRQANLARTQVALNACRHLLAMLPSEQRLVELQRSELGVSQMISDHVQRWSAQSIWDDWDGYRQATSIVLDRVRDLITAEKKVLCPLLGAPH